MSSAGVRSKFEQAGISEFPMSVGLREMVAVVCKRRWRVLAAGLVPPLLALAFVLALANTFRAQSDIMVKTGREYLAQTEGESAMTAPTSTKQEGINSEIAMLTSRAVVEATIAAVGLERLYPRLLDSPPWSGSVLDAAVEKFGRDLSVDPVKLSNVISTSFDAGSPELAKLVLDTLIRIYIGKHTEVFAGSRAESYQDSITQAMQEIRRLEQRRSDIKLESGIYDIAAQRQAIISQRVDAENRLQDALNRQAKLTAKLEYLATARNQIAATTTSTSTEKNDVSVHAHGALIDLRQTEASLAARYGDANPELQRVRSQIATIERAANATSASRTNTATSPSAARQQVEQQIVLDKAELTTMRAEVERHRAVGEERTGELRRLERAELDLRSTVLRIDVLTDNLKGMQARYEQARTQEQTELARQVSVVQVAKAIAPEKAVKPKKLIFALAGVLGGILLAGAVAVISILMNKTAITEDAAERVLGLPVLAVLPVRSRHNGPVTLELE